ncbi:MAG: DsrE family protein [Deltaproteobacteria bacterium]|nr:DsrE family protein [Deltaproteobacteria bacterium]
MPPLLIHLHAEGYERAYQALSLAVTARAMSQAVTLVLAFGALRALAEDRLGEPLPGPDLWSAKRAENVGAPTVASLLANARELGVQLWACETVAKTSGVEPEQLEGKLELVGLPQIVRRQQGAQLLYL